MELTNRNLSLLAGVLTFTLANLPEAEKPVEAELRELLRQIEQSLTH